MIETIDLTKKYGDFFALESLDLKLEQGDLDTPVADMGRGLRLRLFHLHASAGDPPGDRVHARHLRRV